MTLIRKIDFWTHFLLHILWISIFPCIGSIFLVCYNRVSWLLESTEAFLDTSHQCNLVSQRATYRIPATIQTTNTYTMSPTFWFQGHFELEVWLKFQNANLYHLNRRSLDSPWPWSGNPWSRLGPGFPHSKKHYIYGPNGLPHVLRTHQG